MIVTFPQDVQRQRAVQALTDTDDAWIARRIRLAPETIQRWHAESFRARQAIAEPVTEIQDARDALGAARHYELRKVHGPPYPGWLAVIDDRARLEQAWQNLRGSSTKS